MFYVKDINGEPITLGESPVFTTCPVCSREHEVNSFFWDDLCDGEIDLYGTSIFCSTECAERWKRQNDRTGLRLLRNEED